MPVESHIETLALRTALRELVALSTIPAAWVGREPPIIGAGLGDVLVGSLQLDFAFVRLCDPRGGGAIEVMRGHAWKAFPEWLQTHPGVVGQFSCKEIVADLGGAEPCRGIVIPIGVNAEAGLVAAACSRTDFPSEIDQLLLSVAANHAAAAFQNARLRHEVDAKVAELRQARNELEMKVAERTADLRRSEAYLAEAQRLSHTGSFGWSVSGGHIVWSDETFRIFEFDPACKPTVEVILQRTHPEDRAFVQETLDQAARDRKAVDFEHRLLMPDGSGKYVRVVGHPSTNDESGDFEFVGAVTDITESKRAEESLQESEAYLAEAQRLSHTGSWASTPATGDIRYWSEECYRVLGFDPRGGQPRFETFFQRIHPDDQRRLEQVERASGDKTGFEFDYRIVHPGGEIREIHTVGHPVFSPSGDLVEYVGTVIDITERKRAEALRDGESRILEMMARDAPLEEILENLVRVVEAQFAGLLCSVLLLAEDGQHTRHGAAPSLPEPYTKAIDGLCIGPKAGSCGTAMYRREPVVVTDILQDPLWEAYREVAEPYGFRACWSTPILAHSGKALGSFAMYYREPRSPGPAETRALEMATHLAGIAIERKLAREERERLRQARADLAHINRVTTMGEVTASLAHEVNQPIAAAVTNANTCLRWLAADKPNLEEARAAAIRIVKDGTRAADIISRIRLLFEKVSPQRELVDVNQVIREMIVLLLSEVTRHSISVRPELAEDLPQIIGDRVQLQQVMMNLMINGIDAMKDVDGMRELAIKSQRAEPEEIVVSVTDSGVGLPSQQAEQIFKAFFTTKPHGTGMGLRISRTIIESHGGRLWAANNSPRGASFCFTLPTKAEAEG